MTETISLSKFAQSIAMNPGTLYRHCKKLNITTSNGLTLEDCDRLTDYLKLDKEEPQDEPENSRGGFLANFTPESVGTELASYDSRSASGDSEVLTVLSQMLAGSHQAKTAGFNESRSNSQGVMDQVTALEFQARYQNRLEMLRRADEQAELDYTKEKLMGVVGKPASA